MDFRVSQQYPTRKLNVPSDSLRSIYQLCEQFPALAELFDLPKPYEFIADSNAAIREVLFTSKYRRNESARTDLRESLQSGAAKIIAPLALRIEMDRHLPTLALEKGISENKLRQEWQELQTCIEFREVTEYEFSPSIVADPDDRPFVALYLNSSADAVLTYDKHISMMGAKAVRPDAIRFVRDYARSKAPEVTLRVGGVLIGGVAIGSVIALLKLVVVALRSFLKLPVEYQLLIIAGLVLAFLHPASRKAIIGGITSLASGLKVPADIFLEVIAELTVKFGEAQLDVRASQTILETTIPRRIVPALPIEQASNTNDKVVSASHDTVPFATSTLFSNELFVRSRVRTTSIRSKRNPKRRSARKRRMKYDAHAN
jgi:predicted nucleic acid-binding protein